jgi:hypothetical protein
LAVLKADLRTASTRHIAGTAMENIENVMEHYRDTLETLPRHQHQYTGQLCTSAPESLGKFGLQAMQRTA